MQDSHVAEHSWQGTLRKLLVTCSTLLSVLSILCTLVDRAGCCSHDMMSAGL